MVNQKNALKDIKFYTKNRKISITIQCQLLKAEYPNTIFLDTDLANTIQYYKVKSYNLESDTSYLLSFLVENVWKNGLLNLNWIVITILFRFFE